MPSEAISDEMTETLSPSAAARVLTDAAGFERALARRTHGLTLVAWGIVSSAMFVSYAFASVLDAVWWVYATLWAPWVALGILTTFALWRSAQLSRPEGSGDWTKGSQWLRVTLVGLGFTIVFWIARPDGPTIPLALLGGAYVLFGALNLFQAHPPERRDTLVAGVLMLAVAAALALTRAPIEVSGLVAIVAPAAILCGFGFREALAG